MNNTASANSSNSSECTVLIVDDEESIRKTLSAVFRDEGFGVETAADGESALTQLSEKLPSLVMLDIWMPGMDGIETLKQIKQRYPDLPVIMISGHATIATAISATRLGAADFIEKPLDLNTTIAAAKRSLSNGCQDVGELGDSEQEAGGVDTFSIGSAGTADLMPIVFSNQALRGKKLVQKTLSRSTILYGQGIHSGQKSGLLLEPLPANSGIHFASVTGGALVPAHVSYVGSTGFATTIRLEETQVGTIEHVMSALHAYGISNVLVKCNGEVPVMDGSALEFCSIIEEVGIEEQEGDWFAIKVPETIRIGKGDEYIQIEPADTFSIDYTLRYPEPVGEQRLSFTLGDVDSYKSEIAPARTFGFVKDVGALQRQGLALGGRFDNFVLFGDEGVINDDLRFADEPVRHKILDTIGDLYLLGRPIQGKVTAYLTGHSDNIEILKELREKLLAST